MFGNHRLILAAATIPFAVTALGLSGCSQVSEESSTSPVSDASTMQAPVRIATSAITDEPIEVKVGQTAFIDGIPTGVATQITTSDESIVSANQAVLDDTTIATSIPGPGFTGRAAGTAEVFVWEGAANKGKPILTINVKVVP